MKNEEIKEENSHVITYEEVDQRLKGVKLEDYTKDDFFDRYVGYGDEDELSDPKIQQEFLKHNLANELIALVDFITNKEVCNKLITDKSLTEDNIIITQGKIIQIEFVHEVDCDNYQVAIIKFLNKDNETITFNKNIFITPEDALNYEKKLKEYMNDEVVAIYEKRNDINYLGCFGKIN